MPINKIAMFDALKRFTPIADGDQRYVDARHCAKLSLPIGSTVKATSGGIAGILKQSVSVRVTLPLTSAVTDIDLPASQEMPKAQFRALPPEEREPLETTESSWMPVEDQIIAEISRKLSITRARSIHDAILAAMSDESDQDLPEDFFREGDTFETALPLIVAADSKLADIYVPSTPVKFTSFTGIGESEKGGRIPFVTRKNPQYAEAMERAFKRLKGNSKTASGPVQPSPPAAEPDPIPEPLPPPPAPPAADTPPTPVAPTDQRPPFDNDAWWDDAQWASLKDSDDKL